MLSITFQTGAKSAENKSMKKRLFFALALAALQPVFSAPAEGAHAGADDELYEYNKIVLSIEKVSPPYERDGYVIFTESASARRAAIAFDFEGYSVAHPFRVHSLFDIDGNEKESLMFFALKRPEGARQISYRVVIDGLWTVDPNNSDKYFDEDMGMALSRFVFAEDAPPATKTGGLSGATRFVCRDEPGKRIRLAGTFTNWDSWIYEMRETERGVYEIELPLAPGSYFYRYCEGSRQFVDKTNPSRAYSSDGRAVSVITVE